MIKIKLSIFFALFLALSVPAFSSPFISVKDIHPGMVGYGKTVFHGTKIETFKVVVLGVLQKAIADTDLILVKIDSPYLKKEGIGLVAGMSGSPVYFNGKLAGAVAYGWSFTSQPIAGVTPIGAMFGSNPPDKEPAPSIGAPRSIRLPSPIRIGNATIDSVSTSLSGEKTEAVSHTMQLRPLGLTLAASGFNTEGMAGLQSMFPMSDVVPGGGKMRASSPDPPLMPGQSVGAALMQGDMDLVATGTLTYRDGSKVLAFGHPFLFLGDVDFPMVQTYVHYILPSMELPFKFVSSLHNVGHVAQDRLYGIGGVIGAPAHMVPVDVTVDDADRRVTRHFHVEVIRNPDLTPKLASMAISQAIPATSKLLGGATASLDYTISFDGQPPIHKHNLIFSDSNIPEVATAEVLKPIMDVAGNDFQRVNLSKVDVTIKIRSGLAAATLQKVVLDKHDVKPGEPIQVTVWLKPYNHSMVKRTFSLTIPRDVTGNVLIGVGGGPNDDQLRKALSQPPPDPLTVNQIIGQIQDEPAYNSLIIRMQLPRSGMNLGGENFNNVPQAFIDFLKSAGANPLTVHSDGLESRYNMPWVVVGSDLEQVTVEGKENSSSAAPAAPATPTTPAAPTLPSTTTAPDEDATKVDTAAPPLPGSPTLPAQTAPAPAASTGTESSALSLPAAEDDTSTTVQSYQSLKDWQDGTLKRLAISSDGNLLLAPQTNVQARLGEKIILAESVAGGDVYAATANPGMIYKISGGKRTLFFNSKSEAVLSLAALPGGDLLAGTIGGEFYRLSSDGKVLAAYHLPEQYIWQILPADHAVYLATGNPQGVIYKWSGDSASAPQPFARTSDSHVTSLYASRDGKLYAGTADDGTLLEISPDGSVSTLADLDESSILSMTGDDAGNLYLGVGGKGNVYQLSPSGQLRLLAGLPEENISWLGARGGKILAATAIPARLYAIDGSGNVSLLWDGHADEQVGLIGDGASGVFGVSGSASELFEIAPAPFADGEFVSKVLDADGGASWGRLSWRGSVPAGSKIEVETRSGNVPVPDGTWSAWSAAYPPEGSAFESPSARYTQLRVRLSGTGSADPSLEAVSFFWRPANRPPTVSLTTPNPGDVIGPKTILKGKVADPDGDTLLVDLWVSRNGLARKAAELLVPTKPKTPADFSIPLTMIHSDGPLDLRVTVSDSPSNVASSAFTVDAAAKALTFDSTLPSLSVTSVSAGNDKSVEVEGTAEDDSSYVKDVEFQIDNGPWLETVPANGIFDSAKEQFSFRIPVIDNVKQIVIKADDGAGNETTITKTVKDLTNQ